MTCGTTTEADTWLTPAQAARRLDVTPAMVRHWTKHGRLVFELTPLGRLIEPASVERLRSERDRYGAGSPAAARVR
jgi:predicted site-specific integrase-resolvase